MKNIAGFLMVLCFVAGFARGQSWPRTATSGDNEITVYQPQPDSLDGSTLMSRAAISVGAAGEAPVFGAVWLVETLDMNGDSAQVGSVKIDRSHFADLSDDEVSSLVRSLESNAALWRDSFSLSQLRAAMRSIGYRNGPPKIIVSNTPAILLLLDGEPRLQDVGTGGLKQVVNTAFPVIFDPQSRKYWLYGSSVWFTATDIHGKWTWAASAPANVVELVRDTETLASEQAGGGRRATLAELRAARIIVATEPAELLVIDGAPNYSLLVGAELFYVTNTDNDIFMEVATRRHFVLISGRWFAAPSIDGPWSFVQPENLPRAFARIPENSPKADALAFVAGTDRAKDAVLESMIPETAEISRRDARIEVQYDGPPRFSPVPNTSIEYAENTPAQVIRSRGRYYACDQGAWYVGPSPTGPWSISDVRPDGIDDIPPSSPVYNTKFVYVFNATPEYVMVGYLPGYRWSFPYHGVVIYGTGWRYRAWYGRYYYPRPATWGFCARYSPWGGWSFGASWTAGWLGLTSHWGAGWAGWGPIYGVGYRPGFWSRYHGAGWFGPGGYRPPRPPYWHPPGRPAPGRAGTTVPSKPGRPGRGLYHGRGHSGVHPRPHGRPPLAPRPPKPVGPGRAGGPGRGAPGLPPRPPSAPGPRPVPGPRPAPPPSTPGGSSRGPRPQPPAPTPRPDHGKPGAPPSTSQPSRPDRPGRSNADPSHDDRGRSGRGTAPSPRPEADRKQGPR